MKANVSSGVSNMSIARMMCIFNFPPLFLASLQVFVRFSFLFFPEARLEKRHQRSGE